MINKDSFPKSGSRNGSGHFHAQPSANVVDDCDRGPIIVDKHGEVVNLGHFGLHPLNHPTAVVFQCDKKIVVTNIIKSGYDVF